MVPANARDRYIGIGSGLRREIVKIKKEKRIAEILIST